MEKNTPKKSILGCLLRALTGNFLLGAIFLTISIALGGPKIYIELSTAVAAFLIFLAAYLALTIWSILTLSRTKLPEGLVVAGPYFYVRHPMYAAILFLLNPALAILFRSWLFLLSTILVYFIWRSAIRDEEKELEEKFGDKFKNYQAEVSPFFPNLLKINKASFYILTGVAFFVAIFIILNYSALAQRWITWDSTGKIIYDTPKKKKSPFPSGQSDSSSTPNSSTGPNGGSNYQPNYNSSGNSIVISKIKINVPLVQASGTSQKELNVALNNGVIIYPGSAMPGQPGDVFLSGHSSIYPWVKTEYGQVFALLDKLVAGDTVSLIYNNRQYDYRITGKKVLQASEVKIQPTYEYRLTLMTCWPIGTSLKRLVVTGELIR